MVITQKTVGIATKACIIFKEDGKYGFMTSGKTDGAPINKSKARIEIATDSTT